MEGCGHVVRVDVPNSEVSRGLIRRAHLNDSSASQRGATRPCYKLRRMHLLPHDKQKKWETEMTEVDDAEPGVLIENTSIPSSPLIEHSTL